MKTENNVAVAQQTAQLAEIKEKLVRTVRSNSKKDSALTSLHATSTLPGVSLEKRRALAAEITSDPAYPDLRSLITSCGLVYLYSASHITATEAARKGDQEQAKFLIAETVRKDSRDRIAITPLSRVASLCPEKDQERLKEMIEEMQAEWRYQDLKRVHDSGNGVYFYSDMHMTDKYAALLARTAAKDPCAVVADTVREESQIWPRPTNVQIFKSQVYGIPYHSIEATIAGVLQNPAYADIRKVVHPATGAVYLYSVQHMNERDALCAIQQEQGGQE